MVILVINTWNMGWQAVKLDTKKWQNIGFSYQVCTVQTSSLLRKRPILKSPLENIDSRKLQGDFSCSPSCWDYLCTCIPSKRVITKGKATSYDCLCLDPHHSTNVSGITADLTDFFKYRIILGKENVFVWEKVIIHLCPYVHTSLGKWWDSS